MCKGNVYSLQMQLLYFTLNGTVYLPGDAVLITDVGEFRNATSLICITSCVNTQCCTDSDDNVGEWYFPDGTVIPQNSSIADFSSSGSTEQVHLNRRNDALAPTGEYSCRVRDGNDSALIHNASITLGECMNGFTDTHFQYKVP